MTDSIPLTVSDPPSQSTVPTRTEWLVPRGLPRCPAPILRPSALDRLDACPASGALPQVERDNANAAAGTAMHRYLRDCLVSGDPVAALARVPGEHRERCADIDLEALPHGASGKWRAEIHFSLDPVTMECWEMPEANDPDRELLHGTPDVHLTDGPLAIILDYKSPHQKLVPAAESLQLGAYALMVSEAHGCDLVTVGHARILDDGSVRLELAELDAVQLGAAAHRIRSIRDRVGSAHGQLGAGLTPTVKEGDHCRYCPAITSCPAKLSLLSVLVNGSPAGEFDDTLALNWIAAVGSVATARKVLERAEEVLEQYAREHPIELPDGKVYGPVEKQIERLDGPIARFALATKYGATVADTAVKTEMKATKTGVEKAARAHAQVTGRTLKVETAEMLEAIREAGGASTERRIEVRVHRPEKALPRGEK